MCILINKTSLICSVCISWNVYYSNINNYASSGMYIAKHVTHRDDDDDDDDDNGNDDDFDIDACTS